MKRFANVRPTVFIVSLALTAALGAVPALAQLEGDTINCAMGFAPGSLFFTPGTSAVVGAGVEFTLEQPSTPLFSFNFTGNSLTITSLASINSISQAAPIIFSSIDWPADPSAYIAGVYVSQSSGIIGAGNVTFTGHTLTVNLCCGLWHYGDSATIDLYPESGLIPAETQSWGAIKAHYR
jgi:hypothetical protein